MLKRNANFCDNDLLDDDIKEGDDKYIEERFNDLNIESANINDILSLLSDNEKREFEQMIESGKIGELIDVWTPWWTIDRKLVEEVSAKESRVNLPEIHPQIQSLNELTSVSVLYKRVFKLFYYFYNTNLFIFIHSEIAIRFYSLCSNQHFVRLLLYMSTF